MQVDAIDFYYLSMPTVLDIGDGSQDVLLVRVRAGGWQGWGECDASPLVSIASLVAPMSHSACKPVQASVLGQRLDSPADIARIGAEVRSSSYDQLQAAHTWSGVDIALWDLLGRRYEQPVHQLLGLPIARPKRPYASMLFQPTPQQTWQRAARAVADGYEGVKFGWGGFGTGTVEADREQLAAAREGLGAGVELMVDAAMAWGEDVDAARARVPALEEFAVHFVEEPFFPGADAAYRALRRELTGVGIAGGEGCHAAELAVAMMDHAGVDHIQIDAGRIGGITAARRVAVEARRRGTTFINHTFTSPLALSASLQPFLDDDSSSWCEYPTEPQPVSAELTADPLLRGADGLVRAPEGPGLGVSINHATVARYLLETEIRVGGRVLYRTPPLHPGSERDPETERSAS